MFKEHGFCARFSAAVATISLGLATSMPVQAHGTLTALAPGTINVLHSFAGTDGANPQGNVELGVQVSGSTLTTTVYGVAQSGGLGADGTIFSQGTQAGATFSDVFNFAGANGATPTGGLSGLLTDYTISGPFVGVTSSGGQYGLGAIYEATSNGAQTVLYSFTGLGDGANPVGRLLFKNGGFYGTTSAGALGFGTVFRYSLAHGLQTLHHFTGGNDGATPLAGLSLRLTIPASLVKARSAALAGRSIDARRTPNSQYCDPNLYGTTSSGGAAGTGAGTIFKIAPSGKLTTLFTFGNTLAAPGSTPAAELATDFNGNLYGTTLTGGSAGIGEVFVYNANGTFAVLHDFAVDAVSGNETTGANPLAPLTVALNGTVYGTTSSGSINGLGNVFSILGTTFTLKYEFSGPDGASPESSLVDGLDGNLYSTTSSGGVNGLGTIFAVGE